MLAQWLNFAKLKTDARRARRRTTRVETRIGYYFFFIVWRPPLVITTGSSPPIFAGAGKLMTGSSLRAPFINAVQILAGKVPPVTDVRPPIPFSDYDALSRKSATDAASCGVYALNQADAFDCDVPVLPAAGRPSERAAPPVPPLTTLLSA